MKRILLLLAALPLLGAGCAEQAPVNNPVTQTPPAITNAAPPSVNAVAPAANPPVTERPGNAASPLLKVTKVVDGDTIDVEIDGKVERVRLIGIDTPETVDPRKPVECFGKEASDRAKKVLGGQSVKLEADATQDERDKYGRLLRYVFLADGTNFNEQMIRDGYAHEYTYHLPYKYQTEFKTAEKEAKAAKRGLWADGACATKSVNQPAPAPATTTPAPTTAPTPTPQTTVEPAPAPAPTPAPTPEPAPAPAPTTEPAPTPAPTPTQSASACDCSGNIYNCTDFKTHAAAQAVYDCCMAKVGTDIHRLDSNHDGQACESLP
jgi:micrococcal nuclease